MALYDAYAWFYNYPAKGSVWYKLGIEHDLDRFSVAVMKHCDTKPHVEEKGFISLTGPNNNSIFKSNEGRDSIRT